MLRALPWMACLPVLSAQSFEPFTTGFLSPSFFYSASAVADFDGDGDLDVLSAPSSLGNLELHRNDGEGRFIREVTPHTLVQGGFIVFVKSLVPADVDGDGDQDVFVGVNREPDYCGGANNFLLRNNGAGVFTQQQISTVADLTQQLLPFDFDNDGDLDVVSCNASVTYFCVPVSSRLLRNIGAGVFTDITSTALSPVPSQNVSVAALDVQGDGWLDLVFAGSPVQVFLNAAGTSLVLTPSVLPHSLQNLRSADLDGDGDTDLVGTNNGVVRILRNDGAGVFTAIGGPAHPPGASKVEFGDIDADGDLDLAISSGNWLQTQGTVLWRQDPGTTFTDVTATHLAGVTRMFASAAFLDSDGDGDRDLYLDTTGLLHNDGTGHFARLEPWPLDLTPRGRAVDLDNDGYIDVLGMVPGGSGYGETGWWRNDRAGQFPSYGTLWNVPLAADTVLTTLDLDADGDQDVFVGRYTKRVFRNDGNWVFTDITATSLPPGENPPAPFNLNVIAAVPGDFDQDGDVDLFLGRGPQYPASSQDALLLNNGTGVFVYAPASSIVDPNDTMDAVGLDFDGDGDLDLATTNSPGPVRLFANDGLAHFTDVSAARLPPGLIASYVVAVDVDGDQDQDLVFGPTARLLRNNNGFFIDASAQLPPLATFSYWPKAADFDVDGDLDLNLGAQWLANNGLGTFSLAGTMAGWQNASKDAFQRDIDDDGDPDWLAYARNLHRQLENSLPPRLGFHGELRLHARTNTAGWTPLAALLISTQLAPSPIALGGLGTLRLDPASAVTHSIHVITASAGFSMLRYLCPNNPSLLGSTIWTQALFANGPALSHWHLSSLVPLTVRQ